MRERLLKAWTEMKPRERRVLAIGAVLSVLIVGYWVAERVWTWSDEMTTESAAIQRELRVAQRVLERQDEIEADRRRLHADTEAVREQLLQGSSANVAAGELQRQLESMAQSMGLALDRFQPQGNKEVGRYGEVAWEVSFRGTPAQLRDFLHNVESSRRLLRVDTVQVRVLNIRTPELVQVTMKVSGYYQPPVPTGGSTDA